MLNTTESMTFVKSLLDDAVVYGYEDISGGDSAETQLEADLNICSQEVLFNELLDVMTENIYSNIQAKLFTEYDYNDKKLFYAECYFIASLFLRKYSLRYETELFKSQVDMNNKTTTTEKSGKIFSSNEYYSKAKAYLYKIDDSSPVEPENQSMSIHRY